VKLWYWDEYIPAGGARGYFWGKLGACDETSGGLQRETKVKKTL